jgi:hypothetical protein
MTANQYFKCKNQPKTCIVMEERNLRRFDRGGAWGKCDSFGGKRVWKDVE